MTLAADAGPLSWRLTRAVPGTQRVLLPPGRPLAQGGMCPRGLQEEGSGLVDVVQVCPPHIATSLCGSEQRVEV